MRDTILAVLSCLACASAAIAGEESVPNFAEGTLSGDWGGARGKAAKHGILFETAIKVDALRNRGALSTGAKTVSHADFKLRLDFETALGWQGGSGLLNIISDSGWGPNARHVGALMGTTNLEVAAPTTTRVFHAWLQQSLLDDGLSVRAGIYPIDSEFQVMDSAGVFVKPEYGPSAELALTRGPSIFNNAAFGIRSKLQTADKTLYAQWALMDGIPNDPARPKRTAIRFAKGDGAFNIGEIGWLPEAANEKFQGHAKVALGLWGYTARVNDLIDVDPAGNPIRRRSHGAYVLAEKTLARLGADGARYISGFIRPSWTDGDSSAIRNTLNLGLMVKGPLASRPDDVIGVAWSRAGLSDKWRTTQLPAPTGHSEEALEVTYRYAVTPWFAIQPNVQHTKRPGGRTDIPAATLIGARFEVIL
ncbi:MAG: carbohydrate porin [Rhodocyclales bacterium]|nr:carbohydrate porin [Rhodocyclales bacterium]